MQPARRCGPDFAKQCQLTVIVGNYSGVTRSFQRIESVLRRWLTGEALGKHVAVQTATRSVVERSFAWLDKSRRLWKNCERHFNTSLRFVYFAYSTFFGADTQETVNTFLCALIRYPLSGASCPSSICSLSVMLGRGVALASASHTPNGRSARARRGAVRATTRR